MADDYAHLQNQADLLIDAAVKRVRRELESVRRELEAETVMLKNLVQQQAEKVDTEKGKVRAGMMQLEAEKKKFDTLSCVYHVISNKYSPFIAQEAAEAHADIGTGNDGGEAVEEADYLHASVGFVDNGVPPGGVTLEEADDLHASVGFVDNGVPPEAPIDVAAPIADPVDEVFHSAEEEFPQDFYLAPSSFPPTSGKAARRYRKRLLKKKAS